jgi:type III pantothenate kinase
MLLLDAGNSRCKWAYVENGAWVHHGAVDNADIAALQQTFAGLPQPVRVIVSNVGGLAREQELRQLCSLWPVPPEFVTACREACGVSNRYEEPSRLGSDRWAALIAAWRRVGQRCLVVNCGTATTVDALSERGEFIGGLILPGITLMRQSLSRGTAQLPDVQGQIRDFPCNTADAIHSGVLRATLGAIRHQYELLAADGVAVCVLGGGAADRLQALLGMPLQRVDNLVLEGLQVIGETSA